MSGEYGSSPYGTEPYGGLLVDDTPKVAWGLGNRFFLAGVDVSGDVAAIDECAGSIELHDVTRLSKSAFERIGGLRDGLIKFTAYFNPEPVATGLGYGLGGYGTSGYGD